VQKKNVQKKKDYSALKYDLVIYGFIAIILGMMIFGFYSLGYFNLSCSMQSGFFCHNVALATNGNLTLSISGVYFSEATGSVANNAIFYVAPQNTGFNPVGFPTTVYKCYPSDVNLVSGQAINLVCQIPSLNGTSVGTPFVGTIWMNFSQSPTEPAVLTEQIGVIVTKSS